MNITTANVFQLEWPESSLTRRILEDLKDHFGGSIPDAADEESALSLVRECLKFLIDTQNPAPIFSYAHLKDGDARFSASVDRIDPPTFEVIRHDSYGDTYVEVVVRRTITFQPTEMKKVIKTITVDGVEYQNASMERVPGPLKETEEVFSVFAYPKTIRIFSVGK